MQGPSGRSVDQERARQLERRKRADKLGMSLAHVPFGISLQILEVLPLEEVAAAARHDLRDHLADKTA